MLSCIPTASNNCTFYVSVLWLISFSHNTNYFSMLFSCQVYGSPQIYVVPEIIFFGHFIVCNLRDWKWCNACLQNHSHWEQVSGRRAEWHGRWRCDAFVLTHLRVDQSRSGLVFLSWNNPMHKDQLQFKNSHFLITRTSYWLLNLGL